jgi:hypothetical protein
MKGQPNIFNYATNELTQDAFLSWVLAWAKPEFKPSNESLHLLGTDFLRSLLAKESFELGAVEKLEIKQQFKKIDVLVHLETNGKKYAIIIEDKVYSGPHSDQLMRYKSIVSDQYKEAIQVPIYFKTGYQHNLTSVENKGYHHYSLKDFLAVLTTERVAEINHDVLSQYHEFLAHKEPHYNWAENETKEYLNKPIGDWSWWSCVGFFHAYKEHFKGGWGSVGNNREPLLAMWFGGVPFDINNNDGDVINFNLYADVQFSNKGLNVQFRVGLNKNHQSNPNLRNKIYDAFLPYLKDNNIAIKKATFRKAKQTLLLGKVTNLDSSIHCKDFVPFLEKCQAVMKQFVADLKGSL